MGMTLVLRPARAMDEELFYEELLDGDLFGMFGRQSPPPLQKYLRKHPQDVEIHVNKEKDLRHIILQAAENGYVDVMRQALPVLAELLRRHSCLDKTPDFKSLLDFHEGKGELKQV